MRFSIVIPTFNSKVSLNNTLEALNYQSGYETTDYEVVVSDDGSTDGTYEYIKNTPKNYTLKYIYLDRCPQSCRSRTRNEGRKAAHGEIIIYLDSDMIVKRNFLSEVDRYFSFNDRFVLLGTRIMIDTPINFKDIKSQKVFELYRFEPKRYDILEFRHYLYEQYSYNANAILFPWMQVYSCNIIVAKKWLDEVGGFDENLVKWGMEDVEFGYTLFKHGLKIAINTKLEGLHQNHGARNDLIIELSKVKAYDNNIDYFLKKHPEGLTVRSTIAHKFLKGEIPMHRFNLSFPKKNIYLSYENGKNIDDLKMETMHYVNSEGFNIVLEDFKEDANLDLWIQSLGKTKSIVRYFPQSRRLNVKEFGVFLDEERKRQRTRDLKKHSSSALLQTADIGSR